MVKLKLVKDSNKSYVIREKDYSDLMDIVLNLRMIEDILLSLLKNDDDKTTTVFTRTKSFYLLYVFACIKYRYISHYPSFYK